ncbi:peptidoglycan-binding protein [Chryseobacterium sp. LC2016-29]|uniref:peptidoglycan-binding domain-containing protein n=1 Tax=Chryseobacterium sp. LC2016-29 TaxID=2897331 RepID=UPI001E2DCED7|nr:peptidoglycan-binding domain-containing protein [Chryseobacterium sp. LC2016-29]MCD0478910.1 peptidoglycan-binding protein [Chryseobacterium sp. LC2016-29]
MGTVDIGGIAEVVFRMPSYTMAVLIANMRIASGDKNEGATHEYYVTADVVNKNIQKASANVNVINPTYNPTPPRQREMPKGHTPQPSKPKPVSERPKPKPDSPKFPVTTGGKSQSDGQGKILSAEFVDKSGNKLHSSKVGTTVFLKITAKNMKNKKVKVKIWEEDNFKWTNDLIFEKDYVLVDDTNFTWVQLTKKMFDKASDGVGDSSGQDYFIEVIHNETSVTSEVMPVSADAEPTKVESGKSATSINEVKIEPKSCGEKYCIKKGDKNELIREINIRLSGFGGNVPTDEFTDRTEKMIKQFQRDYMKVPETGKVCGNVLRAINDFQSNYPLNFDEIKCKCGSCTGFGKERNSEEYQNTKFLEKHRKYEYPGVHRSLLWCYRATLFYINRDTQLNFKTKWIESGYRCHNHYIYIRDRTTNHCGKALDIHYNILSTGKRTKSNNDMNKIRKEIFKKYTGAKEDWNSGSDIFYLESFATTWIHVDVREFSQKYLTKKYFAKNSSDLNGKNIIALANELGFGKTCLCGGSFSSTKQETNNESEKSKWSHTEFANLIAKEESRDNYSICNQTKGGLKIINNVKVVELTIKKYKKNRKIEMFLQ